MILKRVWPITVIFGSIHTKMPSIKSVKVGDVIYPVTLVNNSLYVAAKMPVEQIEVAALSEHGSTIKLRLIPSEKIKELRFGATKSKQKPLKIDKNGNPSILSVSSCIRKMSDETKIIFDSVFEEEE